MALKQLLKHFIDYNIVKEKKRTQRKTAINDENTINTLAAVQLNPMINTRQLERECQY